MPTGESLKIAFEAVIKAWEQAYDLMDLLMVSLREKLENDEDMTDYNLYLDKNHEDEHWPIEDVCTGYLRQIRVKKRGRGKTNAYAYIAATAIFYDEDDAKIIGWEPAIYVDFGFGEERFVIEEVFLNDKAGYDPDIINDSILKREDEEQYENWSFAVPLVLIRNKEVLESQIVKPAVAFVTQILKGKDNKIIDLKNIFPENSIAFKYVKTGDTIEIKKTESGSGI